jgi:hypothetical protein
MPYLQDGGGFATYKKPAAPKQTAPVYIPPNQTTQPFTPVPFSQNPAAPIASGGAPAAAPPAAPAPQQAAAPSAPAYNYQTAPIKDILGGDPFYQQLLGLDKAQTQEDQAWMQQQIHQQQRYYGSASDPLSVLGQIAVRYGDTLKQIENNLASRGMIFSGEFGARGNRARQDMEWSNVQANFQLQNYIAGLKQAFTQGQRTRQQNELQAQLDAVNRWLSTHEPTPTAESVQQYVESAGGGGGGGEAPAPAPAPAPAAKQTSFQWGDRAWGPGDKAAFSKWLSSRGASLATWIANHQSTAQAMGWA